ncbi:MAG: phosphotriesterase family protein [Thermoguttaceae bacterium]
MPPAPFIRTVTGDIAPDSLGVTHAHEHTIILAGPSSRVNSALLLDDVDKTAHGLEDFRRTGGCSLVDAQPIGVERSPQLMRLLSERSGVQIVATTGFHRGCFYPSDHFVWSESADKLAARMISELNDGMFDDAAQKQTDIRAGCVKFASEYHFVPPVVEKIVEAVAAAHHATGAPIITHTEMGTCGLEQIELASRYGVSASAMIISHLDRNPDRFLHREIAATGAFLVYDGIARTKYFPDSTIIDLILAMVDSGFASQILLAMDAAPRTIWPSYGGGPGLSYLQNRFVPRLLKAGVAPELVTMFLVTNPARALTFRTPPR